MAEQASTICSKCKGHFAKNQFRIWVDQGLVKLEDVRVCQKGHIWVAESIVLEKAQQ